MECQASDSKKLFKVFDASKRKKSRKKREGFDDTTSVATDESVSGNMRCAASAKNSLQEMTTAQGDAPTDAHVKRDRDSSPSISNSPALAAHRSTRSPRRHRRPQREGLSLALKAGLVSTPRSISPPQDDCTDHVPADQDSFIYAFLEEAIKRDKRKQRHLRRHDEERRASRDRDTSICREHRHHHRHRREDDAYAIPPLHHSPKERPAPAPVLDQTALIETFAKLCARISDKAAPVQCSNVKELTRCHSHKSLQCEVMTRQDYDVDQRPVRLRSRDVSRTEIPSSKVRSQENFHDSRTKIRSPERVPSSAPVNRKEKYYPPYERDAAKYSSKIDLSGSRMRNVPDDSFHEYHPRACPTRSLMNPSYRHQEPHDRRDYDYRRERPRQYEDEKRRYCEQKTSRSFDVRREVYDEDRGGRRSTRSDSRRKRYEDPRDKRYEDPRDKRYEDPRDKRFDERRDRYYDDKGSRDRHYSNLPSKDRRSRRNLERFEKNSVISREDEYRERDSGLSVADDSTISGKSNYLRVVKQEIAEQRESMDKMMKLWKELMRCFKGTQSQGSDKVNESAATMQESAAAQLRLWRECMRRYETVARDVGDTDARLMEEINKQRSEMAEMASMWQECLQRYRDMSNDFNNLKQQLATSESPTRGPVTPLVCAEGEGAMPPAPPYRLPPNYPQMPQVHAGYMGVGSPLRTRASAPPPWWWLNEQQPSRRRSSPESRASRSRERRHRKDRDESRYKEKSSKPAAAARSEHRHRKR